jgi:hypothetical protein
VDARQWRRVGFILTLGWWLLATVLYFSQVGRVLSGDGVFYPSWVYTWNGFTLRHVMLFDDPPSYGCGPRTWCAPVHFDRTGYCAFLAIPVIFGWAVAFYAALLRRIFAGTPLLPRGTWGRAAAGLYVAMLHWLLWIAIFDDGKETEFVVGFWLELLSFPVGLPLLGLFRLAFEAMPGTAADAIGGFLTVVLCVLTALAGYLQWFVLVPWMFRTNMGASRSREQEARRSG